MKKKAYIEMVDIEYTLLKEIEDKAMKRNDIVLTYAFGLISSEDIDWPKVNKKIVERWSIDALRYIKNRAWKLVAERIAESERKKKEGEKMKTKIEQKLDREFENMGVKPSIYHLRKGILPFAGVTVAILEGDYNTARNRVWDSMATYHSASGVKAICERQGMPGIAICDLRDQYSKRIGRVIAKGRLLKALRKKNAD